MLKVSVKEEIVSELDQLTLDKLKRVLEYVRSLSRSSELPKGTPGRKLLKYAGLIPPDDLRLMSEAIEEGCERVDISEWDIQFPESPE